MKNLKKDLQAVTKALKGLSVKVEKIQKQVDKMDKPKAKAKPVKRAPAKKAAAKKPATAVDTVIKIINRTKKGVDTAALMKKSGFNQRKVHNVVYKLKKQGKIKSVGKGVYLKA